MQIFGKLKRRVGQPGTGSQLALGGNNQSLSRISTEGQKAASGEALAQDFPNIIETQTTQINELKNELKLKESALKDCLRKVNKSQLNIASQENELQRKIQEVDKLKNELRKQERLIQCHIRNAGEELKKARMTFDKELSQQHENWKKEYECLEQYGAKKNDRHKSLVKELQDLLSNEKRESKHLKDQIAEYRRYLKDELNEKEKLLQVESDKVKNLQARLDSQLAEERAASDAAQSRARHEAETLGEQLDQKGRMIHELDEQVQNLTDTIEQTRLALNRTRNELTEEKRRARQGLEESVTKSQQLEFVQQQCARLQEQLHDMTVITWKPEPIFRTGKDVEDEAEYETPEKFTTRTESDLTEKVECAQQ